MCVLRAGGRTDGFVCLVIFFLICRKQTILPSGGTPQGVLRQMPTYVGAATRVADFDALIKFTLR